LLGWGQFTSSRFVLRTFPGRHFFLREQMAPLIGSVIEDLDDALAAA
jgi:surfactin synthase thioesterase subunit